MAMNRPVVKLIWENRGTSDSAGVLEMENEEEYVINF